MDAIKGLGKNVSQGFKDVGNKLHISEGDGEEKGEGKLEKEEVDHKEVDDPASRKVRLKSGDYTVQVHVIEARDLKGRGIGEMSDPIAVVEVMGKKQHSRIHKSALNCVFDQVFFFEFKGCSPEQVESGKVTISVFDANTFRRNQLIGLYQFDLAGVYYRKYHEIFRTWCALTDVTDKFEGIQGYLKASVVVLGPEDEQHIHSAREMDDEEGDGMMTVLMPPDLEQRGYLLKVQVYQARDLPEMDEGFFGGKCDPFAEVEFGGVKVKTKHVEGQDVDIVQEMQVPVMEPVLAGMIRFTMFDWDQAGTNDRIKSMSFPYNEVKENGFPPQWVNMYGAPHGKQRGFAKKMNRGYVEGSWYRGRVLMAMEVVKEEEPKANVSGATGLRPNEFPREVNYRMQVDLYGGSEIPDKGDMRVEVSCGNNYYSSSPVPVEGGRCEWYEELKDENGGDIAFTFPEDLSQVPKIFVYLCHKDVRISYTTFEFKDAVERGWKVPPEWTILREDKCLSELDFSKAEFPGVLLFSLRVGRAEDCPAKPFAECRPLVNPTMGVRDRTSIISVQEEPQAVQEPEEVATVGTLTLEVIEATDLPALDSDTSDPYVKVEIGNQKFKTKVIKKTLNPRWNETFIFQNTPISSRITVKVYDEDFGRDDKMGEFEIDLRTQQTQSGRPLGSDFKTDSFFLISDEYPNARIRFRFKFKYLSLAQSQAVEAYTSRKSRSASIREMTHDIARKVTGKHDKRVVKNADLGAPDRAQYQLRAHIYQARGLVATDASGSADPYITVRLNGKRIKTKTKRNTLNPQWYESHAVIVDLPVPLSIAPHIQVYVFDWDQLTKDDPIGRFDISVEDAFYMNPSVEELKPKWFQLKDWQNKELKGAKVLASFQLLDGRLSSAPMPSISPPTMPMFVEITTLGMRNLTSVFGVHKSFIEFELPNSKRFKTESSRVPSSKNPNFLQVLKIPIDLPTSRLFAPFVDIDVKDTLFGGLVKRLIGTASIDLAQFMEEDEDGNWRPSSSYKVLNEEELGQEIKEEAAQRAEEKAAEEARAAREAKLAAYEKAQREEDEKEMKMRKTEGSMGDDEDFLQTHSNTLDVAIPHDEKTAIVKSSNSEMDMRHSELDAADEHLDEDDGIGLGTIPEVQKQDPPSRLLEENRPLLDQKEDFDEEDKEAAFSADKLTEMPEGDDADPIPDYMKGRPVCDNELEDIIEMKPFLKIPLYTGQKNAGFLGRKSRKVGTFKGLVRLLESKNQRGGIDVNELLDPKELYLRVYILRCHNLVPCDADGTSDPYLILKCGDTKISTRERKIKNSLDPEFYESFEIPCTIPGDAELEITVMDWDGIGDDTIGTTVIDIEDRWFSKEWRKLPKKPVEMRTLRSPTSTSSQGKIELWVEIITPLDAKKVPMVNITPPPPDPWELRVIIWGCRDVTIKDEFTEQNDLYITCAPSLPGLKKQKTDTHMRSKKGKGNFNWRMKWPLMLPPPRRGLWPRLRFQIWDRDFFSANDSICEAIVSLKGLCRQALKSKDQTKVLIKGKEKFWLEKLRHPNEEGTQGRLQVSIELLPEALARQMPAGFGRSEPNSNPHLPPPEGRVKWSFLHPLDMLRELLGDRLYRKLCIAFCCFILISAISFIAPMIASNLVQKGVDSLF